MADLDPGRARDRAVLLTGAGRAGGAGGPEEETAQRLAEFEEEHGGDEGVFDGLEERAGRLEGEGAGPRDGAEGAHHERLPAHAGAQAGEGDQQDVVRLRSRGRRGCEDADDVFAELDVLHGWLRLSDEETTQKKALKEARTSSTRP